MDLMIIWSLLKVWADMKIRSILIWWKKEMESIWSWEKGTKKDPL